MKPAPISKKSSLSPDSKPAAAVARPAGKSSGAAASQHRSGGMSRRTQNARRQPANAAAVPISGTKAGGKPQPSAVFTSESMKAIREDRGTTIALYTLFGAVLAGVIYFIALLLLV